MLVAVLVILNTHATRPERHCALGPTHKKIALTPNTVDDRQHMCWPSFRKSSIHPIDRLCHPSSFNSQQYQNEGEKTMPCTEMTQLIIGEALTDHYVKDIVGKMQDHVRNIPEL